ncbi:thermostable hemolysin [Insolitispirillum peregrinum]|uniref:thermostable hemolysin n=1 Tax=Insolitispirillum peregrinum TaxID=80876 RepID=UPI0036225D6C
MVIILADRTHSQRAALEQMVRNVFQASYQADVPSFPDHLVAALDETGSPVAVAGVRSVRDGFFSEVYLDGSAESVLSSVCGSRVARDEIVEFSSLAAVRPGAAMPLVGAAIGLCLAAGARHGLFTATDRLRALLRRSGLTCVDLGPARPDRLSDAARWGRYYQHDPRVIAVSADSLSSSWRLPVGLSFPEERLHA